MRLGGGKGKGGEEFTTELAEGRGVNGGFGE